MANAPFTSVVVAYFFPVSVFAAVTLTPGSGATPAFTEPVMVPPLVSAAVAAAVLTAVAGSVGRAGAVCPQAPAAKAKLVANPKINRRTQPSHLRNLTNSQTKVCVPLRQHSTVYANRGKAVWEGSALSTHLGCIDDVAHLWHIPASLVLNSWNESAAERQMLKVAPLYGFGAMRARTNCAAGAGQVRSANISLLDCLLLLDAAFAMGKSPIKQDSTSIALTGG